MKTIKTIVLYSIALGLALFVYTNLSIEVASMVYIKDKKENLDPHFVAVVLGAGVDDEGEMSPYLKDRANAAIELYKDGIVENILVSGDNSRTTYDEVEPVKDYFLAQGVFSGDIYLDHAGFDTYDSMVRARDVFGLDELIIISQRYHLPRAVITARLLGMDAYAYPSQEYNGTLSNKARESLARIKSLLEVIFNVEPQFEGERINIE